MEVGLSPFLFVVVTDVRIVVIRNGEICDFLCADDLAIITEAMTEMHLEIVKFNRQSCME